MDDDYRELANRLFAAATAMLEDATELAVAGQSARLTSSLLAHQSRWLQAAVRDIAIIAEAAMIVANLGINQPAIGRNLRAERTGLAPQSKHCLLTI